MMYILVLNCGGSSVKFQVFDMPSAQVIAKGMVERIGKTDAVLHYNSVCHEAWQKEMPISDHKEAISTALLCSECGICDMFACPLDLSPRRINMAIKEELAKRGFKNPHHNADLTAHPFRDGRLIPVERLIARLGLNQYNKPAPLIMDEQIVKKVTLPLKQSTGVPVTPLVKTGDRVEKGQLVGSVPKGQLGANLHASIAGVVRAIGQEIVIEGI
ncbi:hypothetical protein [Mahella sp.]|uniref:hypothetical protein n=1 Tax=Mahella sp. TaxID=2798721 RepID=UPI0025C41590|nr:hypothetical protein [Mahella sp.]MBZ4666562.1 Respiratory-chain dehydrogenase domain 51 kDa subunit [Mahella sp.]